MELVGRRRLIFSFVRIWIFLEKQNSKLNPLIESSESAEEGGESMAMLQELSGERRLLKEMVVQLSEVALMRRL